MLLKFEIAPESKTLSLIAFKVHNTSMIKTANFLLKALFWSLNQFKISTKPVERLVAWYKGDNASAKRCKLFHDLAPEKSILDLIKVIKEFFSSTVILLNLSLSL